MDNKLNIDGIEYSHSDILQQAMDKTIEDAKKLFPLFPYPSPFTELKGEGINLKKIIKYGDESLDDLFGTSGYTVNKGYLKIYHDELIKFEIDEMLNDNTDLNIRDIIVLVKHAGELIKENSDTPNFIQNKILGILIECNEFKQVGLIIQVLFLQGMLQWFEYCDLNEGDPGSEEAQNLVNWIYKKFEEACVYYFLILGNNEITKPLTNYLKSLEIGKAWEELEIKQVLSEHRIENNSNNKTESTEQQKKGGAPKKVVDESLSLKGIMHKDLYKDAVLYYTEKMLKKTFKKLQYGQLIREFIKKDWIIADYKDLSPDQLSYLIKKEFKIKVSPETARRDPSGNEFKDLKKIVPEVHNM